MNEIAINPVTIKVIPIPLSGAGIFEYFSFSRIAAIPTMASIQPIPEPKPKAVASPMLAYPLSCMNKGCSHDGAVYRDQRKKDS